MTKIIRDVDEIREILTDLQDNNQLRFVEIKSVKLRNPVHRGQQQLKNIFVIAYTDGSAKPILLSGLSGNGGEVFYLSHLWYNHCNVCPSLDSTVLELETKDGTKYSVLGHEFCNVVTQHHIWNSPVAAEKIIKGNLMARNPNDSYSVELSVDVDVVTLPLFKSDRTLLKSDSTFREFLDASGMIQERQVELIGKLRVNKNLRYGYYANISDGCVSTSLRLGLYDINDMDKLITSNYYRAYSYDDLDEEAKNYKLEYEFIVGGCGSSSSQIIDQLARTTYLSSALLIDFDIVEDKNLRNQVYSKQDIGLKKTNRLVGFIQSINPDIRVATRNDKIENIPLEGLKCKYFISGFDNIDARLYAVDKIISKDFEVDYLVDARYDRLDASLYTIDCSNEDELKYYRDILMEDKIYFDAQKKYLDLDSLEELEKYLRKNGVLSSRCADFTKEIGFPLPHNLCKYVGDGPINITERCGCKNCLKLWQSALKQAVENGNWKIPEIKVPTEEGCTARNIIHIYKYVSSWVASSIMSIENNDTKLFTHVDMTVEPLPKAIIIRK